MNESNCLLDGGCKNLKVSLDETVTYLNKFESNNDAAAHPFVSLVLLFRLFFCFTCSFVLVVHLFGHSFGWVLGILLVKKMCDGWTDRPTDGQTLL